MSQFYKKIENTVDLKAFDDLAAVEGKQAIGISNSGALYKWNRGARKAEKITVDESRELLGITDDELNKIIESRGAYVVEDHVPVPEPEPVEVPEVPVVDLTEVKELLAEVKGLLANLHDEVIELRFELKGEKTNLEAKVESLTNTLVEIKNALVLE